MPGDKESAVKRPNPQHLRYTFEDFNRQFPDKDACLEHIKEQRWPKGVTFCEKCRAEKKHHRVTGRTAYACETCGWHIYPLAGTILEKTTTSLRTWFYAIYLMGSTRCGISAKQIQRETSVTYKTAWRIFKQIRLMLLEDIQLESAVEVDETYFRKAPRFGPRGQAGAEAAAGPPGAGDPQKTPTVGIVHRKGRVIAKATRDVKVHPRSGQLIFHSILAEVTKRALTKNK